MGLIIKEWCLLRVLPYEARKEVESSSFEEETFWRRACAVKSRPLMEIVRELKDDGLSKEREEAYRTNHTRPSVAVCFLALSSFLTRSCRVSESIDAASCLSLIFWYLVSPSLGECSLRLACLDVATHVRLDRLEGSRAKDI